MTNDKRITIRLPESDKVRLEDEAKAKNIKPSKLIRQKLGIKDK